MKTALCCPKDRRQKGYKNDALFDSDEHREKRKDILCELKKLKGVSFSNLFERQNKVRSKANCLVLLETKGENFCLIAIYVTGSNVRLEIDCNSLNLKHFKSVELKKIRKDRNLGAGKRGQD